MNQCYIIQVAISDLIFFAYRHFLPADMQLQAVFKPRELLEGIGFDFNTWLSIFIVKENQFKYNRDLIVKSFFIAIFRAGTYDVLLQVKIVFISFHSRESCWFSFLGPPDVRNLALSEQWITDACTTVNPVILDKKKHGIHLAVMSRSWQRSCETHPVEEWVGIPVGTHIFFFLEYISLAVLPLSVFTCVYKCISVGV